MKLNAHIRERERKGERMRVLRQKGGEREDDKTLCSLGHEIFHSFRRSEVSLSFLRIKSVQLLRACVCVVSVDKC